MVSLSLKGKGKVKVKVVSYRVVSRQGHVSCGIILCKSWKQGGEMIDNVGAGSKSKGLNERHTNQAPRAPPASRFDLLQNIIFRYHTGIRQPLLSL